ncbi:Glycosyltransferase involved in cell wall bisynthesis (RfaB) [Fructobacillus tropaeoli]|uniref:Glycosyltransferase involved in cell wall bisynthesis (RfaB) n=1 Tax=Fructobacillus tropaeoli TaxID=709323 RepID=A0ABN9YZV2_9LACO|nr:Glycosyltransferase involved in cell wall bisynthesis (RfaB) [Fructobacillus tropaeoli]CAK1249737.1 Glycosyltransferase involved in cell wall bisynthesis (RfaB) [Fructobacillus tropaeoli]
MHYFLTNKFEYNFSGIEHAQVYRHNLFSALKVESQIVTFEYTPASYVFIKRQGLSVDISLNMFDFWQGAVHKGEINNDEYFDIINNLNGNQDIEYFPFILGSTNAPNKIKKIVFFNNNRDIAKIEYFDIRGFLSQRSSYDKGRLVANEWFNINGEIVLTENFDNGTILLSENNPQYTDKSKIIFSSWDELKSAWLDFLVKVDSTPVIYIDRAEYATPIVIGMKNHEVKKFVVLHSAHTVDRQKPDTSPLNEVRQLEYDNYYLWSGYIASTREQAEDYENRTHIPTVDIPVSYALYPKNVDIKPNKQVKHIVYFSRISREKRIEDAIEAMAYVVKESNNIDLKVYGYVTDSKYNEELHQLIDELSLKDKVYLLPYSPDKESLLQNADLFLLTSEYEGFNMSMIEAASYGLPLVSYDVKYGPNYIINSLQNGCLIESGNIKKLSESIIGILTKDAKYSFFRENGLRLIYKKFGFTAVLKKWKQFFMDNDIEFSSENLYVVTGGSFEENNALKPANLGLKEIAEEHGFISINYPDDSNKIDEFVKSFSLGDKVLLSYPSFVWTMPTHLKYDLDIIQQLKNKGIIVYLFLNDSLILRELSEFMDNEFEILNIVDFILVPSIEMKKALTEIGIKSKFSQPFGLNPLPEYLSNINYLDQKPNKVSKKILYAGNLAKAQFLEQIKCPLPLEVYGPNPSKSLLNNDYISYKGNLSIENLSEKMSHYTGFGLVWDGEYRAGFNKYSRYNRYNMPYKASHYLQNGIPIIAWSGSSLGKFIKKNKIGIVIDSLDDLNQLMSKLTDNDIKLYRENIKNINEVMLIKKSELTDIISKIVID